MKVFQSKSSRSILMVLSLLFIGSILVLPACFPDDDNEKTGDTTLSGIGKERVHRLNKAWRNADSTSTANSFYIKADTGKVLSYQISRAEVDTLLLAADTENSHPLNLRILMALDSQSSLTQATQEPVFRPILELVEIDQDSVFNSKISFEMDYLQMDIIEYLDSIIQWRTSNRINAQRALKLITAWDTLARDSINDVMYEDDKIKKAERIRYYTYNRNDTKKALNYLREKENNLLYLHLGLTDLTKSPFDSIPFCTILHLDNPDNFEHPEQVDADDPPLFEFAAPCPKYCGGNGSFNN